MTQCVTSCDDRYTEALRDRRAATPHVPAPRRSSSSWASPDRASPPSAPRSRSASACRSPTPTTCTRRRTSRRCRPATPLDDADRRPWLETIGALARRPRRRGGVISCSALKRTYRDLLRQPRARRGASCTCTGSREVIARRQASRPGHFMPASLLDSQFATLEPLEPDEAGVVIDVDQSVDPIVEQYVDQHHRVHRPRQEICDVRPVRPPAARRGDRSSSPSPRLAADPGRAARHRPDRRADHLSEGAPVPRPDHRPLTVGAVAGAEHRPTPITSFTTGFGTTAAGVGTLIALGAMFGKLLADSGGADQIVDTIVGQAPRPGAAVGDGRWSARSSACRCSSRSAWSC